MNLTVIKELVESNGGATLTSDIEQAIINDGYMVSLAGYEFKTSTDSLTSELLEEYQELAISNNAYIGFWLDNDDLYVDISINIHNENEAIKVAQENKQLAIYNCKTGGSIYV